MKRFNCFYNASGILVIISLFTACSVENPFEQNEKRLVRFDVSVNSSITRTIDAETLTKLNEQCEIFLYNNNGLLHKWVGVDNLPKEGVYLKYGSYNALAWSGDSVPASYDKKFYKGTTSFAVNGDNASTQVTLICKIENVVTSIDISKLDSYLWDNLKVSVTNAGNSLMFEGEKLTEKGYFMRPYNPDTQSYDSNLLFTISGKDFDGSDFEKPYTYYNAQPGHEYRLVLENDPEGNYSDPNGGANIKITIKDFSLYEDEAIIISAPQFAWEDENGIIDKTITRSGDVFESESLFVAAYPDFASLTLSAEGDVDMQNNLIGTDKVELINISETNKRILEEKGLYIQNDKNASDVMVYKITFMSKWFENLEKRDEPYSLIVSATDTRDKTNKASIKISNTGAPFSIDVDYWNNDLMAIGAKHATINLNLNKIDGISNVALQYRKKGEENWKQELIMPTRASNVSLNLKNLEPGKEYECRLIGGEIVDDDYEYKTSTVVFRTEEIFVLPNADMEQWCQPSKAWIPMPSESEEFWDTGNKGSTAIGASNNLTTRNSDYKHSGEYSACLQSKTIAGILGAGNIYSGSFVGRDGLTNAIVQFGRTYNSTHPSGLKVYARYIPGTISKNSTHFSAGENDKGQIFIALSTQPTIVKTKDKQYFNKDSEDIVAYGEIIWDDKFESTSGDLQEVYIKLDYRPSAKTTQPVYLIIVCSASMYGDYFEGADGSVMYVDDFELMYE